MALRKLDLPPRYLSHYTTLQGLYGIIDSSSLWASNASFLNDKAELTHALDVSKRAISMLSSKKALKDWKSMLEKVFSELSGEQKSSTYVACFCADDDNLSQWRGYGGNVQGVSVTFDRSLLSQRLKINGANLYRVNYSKLSTAVRLRDALAGELSKIAELNESPGEIDQKKKYEDLLVKVSALLPKFKHLGFKDEREWRYVVQKSMANSRVLFRVLDNKMVPYIIIGKKNSKLPITKIRIGPGVDQELTARSVGEFLRAYKYDVEINYSEVPFRR